MPFPPNVKIEALVSCGRCCCICHKFCGLKIEVHHVREESNGGDNTFANAIALCFDCHADMRSYDHQHPKGNKYSELELKRHRDNWYQKVQGNIGIVDARTTVETDKQVYLLLVKTLPWDSLNFICKHNFAGWSFENARLKDLWEFEHLCQNPAFEFIDPDLEALRANLFALVDSFTLTIARETFPIKVPGVDRNTVPEEWEYEQPQRFNRVVTELHDLAQGILETYAALTKTATRKLGVLPASISDLAIDDASVAGTLP